VFRHKPKLHSHAAFVQLYAPTPIGCINLINASINYGLKCFVFISSAAVYGDNKAPFDELQVPLPTDPYGIAKLTVELDLKAAQILFKLPYTLFTDYIMYMANVRI